MVRATGKEAVAVEGELSLGLASSNSKGYFRVKRLLDILGSSILLLLMLIPFIVIGIIIYLFSPGPVVYKSHRYGRDGKVFHFLKFRSMFGHT